METQTTRYYYIDNIKAVLIILVVFGHLLETVSFEQRDFIYDLIYAFHMPAFAFMSGLCYKRKHNAARRIGRYIIIYIVFQVLYTLFNSYLTGEPMPMQFTKPYWILWYLVAMIFWTIAADYLDFSVKSGLAVISVSIVLALAIGYETTFGYNMSLSRTVVFFPFYITGVYISKFREQFTLRLKKIPGIVWKITSLLAVIICTIGIWNEAESINSKWLYDARPYADLDYNAIIRLIFFAAAFAFIFFFLSYAYNKKIFILSAIGRNTLPVYLLHGFVVKYLGYEEWSRYLTHPLLWCILIALILVLLFASKPVVFVFKYVFQYKHLQFKDKKRPFRPI